MACMAGMFVQEFPNGTLRSRWSESPFSGVMNGHRRHGTVWSISIKRTWARFGSLQKRKFRVGDSELGCPVDPAFSPSGNGPFGSTPDQPQERRRVWPRSAPMS